LKITELFGIAGAGLLALLTLPPLRCALRDSLDATSPMAVAMLVCHAEADVGADHFGPCMHRAIPALPPAWPADVSMTPID
jgi:hypothetical protein